jgi:hypothetical protein
MDAGRIVRLLILALPLFLADCGRGEFSAKDIDDIREAVFRHQFGHNASGQQSHVGAYCLGFGERDLGPSSGFLARFGGMSPPVLKSTDCGMDAARRQLIVTATGQPALRFSCADIHRRWMARWTPLAATMKPTLALRGMSTDSRRSMANGLSLQTK